MGIRSNWIPILIFYNYYYRYYRGYRKRMRSKPKVKSEKKMKPIQVQKTIQETMERMGANIEKRGGFKTNEEIEAYKEKMAQLKSQKTIKESLDEAKSYIKTQNCSSGKKKTSYLPTQMTRISPFFPMSKYEMKNRPVEKWERKTGWGHISFVGERLSVYDETILLTLLVLAKKHQSEVVETTQYEICKILDVARSSNAYNAIWHSIDRLAGTKVGIEAKEKNSKDIHQLTGTILTFGHRSSSTGKIKIIINNYFLETFGSKFITRINLNFRNNLKGDISKTLYRFYEGQKNNQYRCRITTLAKAINLNLSLRRLRERFRKALRELKNKEYLSRWGISDEDVVTIWKNK